MALPSEQLMDLQQRSSQNAEDAAESPGTVWTEYRASRWGREEWGPASELLVSLYFRLEPVG